MRNAMDFTVYCTDGGSERKPARYKIAATWEGGGYRELKTFGFADDSCLEEVYQSAIARASRIPLVEGERLGPVRVYLLQPASHDYELMPDLEAESRLAQPPEGP